MTELIKIFGYGSLINIKSLKKTVPEVISFFPAILEGYIRSFETKSTTRFTEDNIPVCVLNIEESSDTILNGVCFEITKEYFDNLLKREGAYELQEIIVKSFATQKDYSAFVFIDKDNEKQKFLFDEPVQIDYLKICLDGAKDFGNDFYEMFLENTLINGYKLKDVKKINCLL